MAFYIGIDLGTSSVKLLIIDEWGKTVHWCQRDYEVAQPKLGWKEIDPSLWIAAIEEGLSELLGVVDKTQVRGIGITGQMHTVIGLDAEGKVLRPALMWNDIRTKTEVEVLKKKIKNTQDTRFIQEILSTGSPAANLYWLKRQEPENFEKLRHFLIGPDYITYYLTGKITTDYCEASTSSLYDIQAQKWSSTMAEILGLSTEVYPSVRGSGEIAGQLRPGLAEKLGLSPEIYVIVGTGDNPAAAVATGCLQGGFPVLSLGTSGVLMLPKDKLELEAKGKNILFSIDHKKIDYLVQGVVQSAGSSYNWLVKTILEAKDFTTELASVDLDKQTQAELFFYPHLVGDKTLYKDPVLRGAFLGLGTDTTRQALMVAVMEGIAFAVKELAEAMRLSENWQGIKVTGGGAKSALWMQILADVLNKDIEQLEGNEGAAMGVAILTHEADLAGKREEKCMHEPSIKKCYHPRTTSVAWYAEKYKKYLKIYQAIKSIYD